MKDGSAELRQLAAFAAAVQSAALPPVVRERARACLLYGLAVGMAAAGSDLPARVARALAPEGPDPGPADPLAAPPAGEGASAVRDWTAAGRGILWATRLLDGRRVAPGDAAFANAVLLHARIQEDAHPAGHVGVVVLPAALAAAERYRADGLGLLAGIVAGYEVALRIGRDHAPALSARGFRTTPAYGVFGAAAAAARLGGLGAARAGDALALAASAAGGLREFVRAGTEEYAVQAGVAAREGLTAAALAAAGVRGAPSALAGAAGFFRAFGADRPEEVAAAAGRLAEGLGETFELLRVSYKPWPICQFHRGIVRGVLALRGQARGAGLAALRIRMHPFEAEFVGVRHAGPFAGFAQTMMSAPFCAALAWVRGAVTFAGLHRFADPEIAAVAGRVRVEADPARARGRPRLELRLADGRELVWEEAAGEEADRLTWAAAVAMTEALAAEAGVPPGLAARLVDAVAALESAGGVGEVVTAVVAATAAARAPAPGP